jgi:hypothetical protein
MVTVQFSRQEMVNMVRRAGLREAASEAIRDLPDPGTILFDGMPPPRLPCAVSRSMNAKGAGRG